MHLGPKFIPSPGQNFKKKTLQVCAFTIQTCPSRGCSSALWLTPCHCDGSRSLVDSLARNLSVLS